MQLVAPGADQVSVSGDPSTSGCGVAVSVTRGRTWTVALADAEPPGPVHVRTNVVSRVMGELWPPPLVADAAGAVANAPSSPEHAVAFEDCHVSAVDWPCSTAVADVVSVIVGAGGGEDPPPPHAARPIDTVAHNAPTRP